MDMTENTRKEGEIMVYLLLGYFSNSHKAMIFCTAL